MRLLFLCLALCPLPLLADPLGPDDPTIRNSLCVGFGCADSEAFPASGTALVKLKAASTGIVFEDTSTLSGFPTTDWQLTANDPTDTGQNRFILEDLSAGTQPFVVLGSAPDNALFVAENGNVGIGASIPQAPLHVETADFDGIRINRSNAFIGAQAWESAVSNVGSYAIKNASSDSVPMSISPGTPHSSLLIDSNRAAFNSLRRDYDFDVSSQIPGAPLIFADAGTNRVALGNRAPAAPLHLQRASTNTTANFAAGVLVEDTGTIAPRGLLTLRNQGQVFFVLEDTSIAAGDNTGRAWNFQNLGGEFRVTTAPGGGTDIEMRLTPAGDMIIEGNYFASSGTQLNVPDYVFEEGYDLRPLSDVQAFIETHKHLPDVPSSDEINATGLNMTDMQMRLLKKIEELTLYALALEETDQAQEAEMTRLRGLEDRLARIEAMLAE